MTGRTLATLEEIMADFEWATTDKKDGDTDAVYRRYFPDLLAIAQGQREELAAKDKKILALRIEAKTKDDTIQKIEQQLQEANECRDPAYFAQLGRKRK